MRLTEYHCGVAVIKNKNLDSEAAKKLAAYEDLGYEPEQVKEIITVLLRVMALSRRTTPQLTEMTDYIERVLTNERF